VLCHGSGRMKGQHLHDPGIPTSNFSLSISPFLFLFCLGTAKEVRREWQMGHADIGVCMGDRQL
jgi:hypothetical protein